MRAANARDSLRFKGSFFKNVLQLTLEMQMFSCLSICIKLGSYNIHV